MSDKYLKHYAEPEINALENITAVYQHCVCIPAFDESTVFIDRVIRFIKRHPASLFIIVLNQPSDKSNSGYRTSNNNLACQQALQNSGQSVWVNQNLQLLNYHNHSAVLVVDRFSKGLTIPANQGVGLARKIAADLALQLISQQVISCPWIYSTDADVRLPDNYFALHRQEKSPSGKDKTEAVAAFVAHYEHISAGSNEIYQATQVYQARLNAYVDGLRYAGSAYAFHTLGSTLCINEKHYAQVRGFPKRAAGEDFYLLNKLRKTGLIVSPKQPIIQIESRQSSRTPFGTGSAVNEIRLFSDHRKAEIFYHPELFNWLKNILQWLSLLSIASFTQSADQQWQTHMANSEIFLSNEKTLIIEVLEELNFNLAYQHCLAQSQNPRQFNRHMRDWFDAFKTLKFFHLVRDKSGYKNISQDHYQQLINGS